MPAIDHSEPAASIGFIGLGDMGGAMALNLIDRGWKLVLHARRAATLEPFHGLPVIIAGSALDLAKQSNIFCLCVVDAAQIEEILFGAGNAAAGLAPGSVVVIHSTVSPQSCIDLAARLQPLGVGLIDAPVTGAAQRGRSGELTLIVGGNAGDIARCHSLFSAMGTTVVQLGGIGSGQLGKLVNNGLFFIQVSLVDELLKLAPQLDLDAAALLAVLDSGTAASWASGYVARAKAGGRGLFQDFETSYPGGPLGIVRKDMGLFLQALEHAGLGQARLADIAAGAVPSMTK